MHEDIIALADRLVALRFEQEPLEAAMLGLDDSPAGLGNLSRAAQGRHGATYRSLAAASVELAQRLGAEGVVLDEREILTLDVMSYASNAAADALSTNLIEVTVSGFHNSPAVELISVLGQLPLDTATRRDAYLERLGEISRVLDQLGERHCDALVEGRTPTRRGVSNAISFLTKVTSDPGVAGLRRAEGDNEFRAAQDRTLGDQVVPALEAYRTLLEENLLAPGRDDEHSGLCALEGGDELYRIMTRVSTSTRRTPEDLHETGISIIEGLREEFAAVGERLWGTQDVAAIHDRLRHDPALRFESAEEIVAAAVATVRRAEGAAGDWFGVVPSTPCAVQPVPEAVAEGAPAAYYFSGALDGSRPGTYFVNATKPRERFRHMSEAVAYHEAVPGHHFQLTINQELPGNHLVHTVFHDVANAEGWGLYAERLADEMGLYSDDVARLGMLSTDAFRAARLVVDTGLHAMGWSRQRAIDWMSDNVPLSPVEIDAEIDRYISMPGQALSYMVGRLEIEELRRASTQQLGDHFDLRSFHDLVLHTGPVSLPALGRAVQRWIANRALDERSPGR